MVVLACNLKAEAEGSLRFQGQLDVHNKTLSQQDQKQKTNKKIKTQSQLIVDHKLPNHVKKQYLMQGLDKTKQPNTGQEAIFIKISKSQQAEILFNSSISTL